MEMKTDPHIEELIDKELAEHGYTRSDFSRHELAELREEIRQRENGAMLLDGFWSGLRFTMFQMKPSELEKAFLAEMQKNVAIGNKEEYVDESQC